MDLNLTFLLNQPPDPKRPYVYLGTRSRINKFGILNPEALDQVVRALSELRGQLLQTAPLKGQFDFNHLCRIHYYLFQDVYRWAGEPRVMACVLVTPPFPARVDETEAASAALLTRSLPAGMNCALLAASSVTLPPSEA